MEVLTREQYQELCSLLKLNGSKYRKCVPVYAKKIQVETEIETITSTGFETKNKSKQDDYLVRNQTDAEEEYIVSKAVFDSKYNYIRDIDSGWAEYESKGEIIGLELDELILQKVKLTKAFFIQTKWKQYQILREGDYIVSPLDYSEFYGIAKKEFSETYKELK
jgi:hypothetical protein